MPNSDEDLAVVDEALLNESEGQASTDDIKTLMTMHRAHIDALKSRVESKLDGKVPISDGIWCQYDDLFYLRYILSFKTVDAALPNVLQTFKWRASPEMQKYITMVSKGTEMDSKVMQAAHSYQVGGIIPGKSQKTGGPTVIVRGGMSRTPALFSNVSIKDQQTVGYIWREQCFFIADKATRESGKLAKQVLVFDMSNMKFSQMMDRRMQAVHGEVSAKCAVIYPQLLSKMCMVNTPSWVYWLIAFLRGILPKRNMDKMEVFASVKDLWNSAWGQATFNQNAIPAFLGGEMADAKVGKWLTGELLVADDAKDSWVSIEVPNRDSLTAKLDVPLGGLAVKYSVSVAAYGVALSASITSTDGKETKVLMESKKIKAENGMISGDLIAPFPGTLTLLFDNTYSMLRWKSVKYKIELDDDQVEKKM